MLGCFLLFCYFFGLGGSVGVVGLLKNKTKLSPARASLLGLSLAIVNGTIMQTTITNNKVSFGAVLSRTYIRAYSNRNKISDKYQSLYIVFFGGSLQFQNLVKS
jgi:hypothetical protein